MTLSNLVSKLNEIQENHPMINTFGEGNIYDYVDNGGEIKYPVMWVVMKPLNYNNKVLSYRATIVFADLLTEDKSNRLQLQSDQLQVALDVIAKLKLDNTYNFNISDSSAIEFFEERFDDFTAGVTADIEILDPNPLDKCSIPT
jgi:hypothetical protein